MKFFLKDLNSNSYLPSLQHTREMKLYNLLLDFFFHIKIFLSEIIFKHIIIQQPTVSTKLGNCCKFRDSKAHLWEFDMCYC